MSTHAGVQVEEDRGPEQRILPCGAARTAFVGRTLRGPVNQPVLLRSFAEFQQVFGGLWQPSMLGYALEHFFDNGGREALVVRVVNGARAATLSLPAGAAVLELRALQPGTREFLRAAVDYDNIPDHDGLQFNLTVQRVRVQDTEQVDDQEIYRRVSVDPSAERYVARLLADSNLVRLARAVPSRRPDPTLAAGGGRATGYIAANTDGDDGAPPTDYDLIGSAAEKSGLFALAHAEHFNLLCIPPPSRTQDVGPAVLLVAARYCRQRRALLIVDPPAVWHTTEEALRGMRTWELRSEHALMYFPRILAHDRLRGHFESFAPCGAVAGMLARTEVGAAPSGAPPEEAILRPGHRPACLVPEAARPRLARRGSNPRQAGRGSPRWGVTARTVAGGAASSADSQSLAARRLELLIVNSIVRGTRWTLAAPAAAATRARLLTQVSEFLEGLHAAGALGARRLDEAYYVMCDERAAGPRGAGGGGQGYVF